MKKFNITIKVIIDGNEYVVNTFSNEYRSLMDLIKDKCYPDGFGQCGGTGRCATCLIKLTSTEIPLTMDRNEQSTLNRSGIDDPAIRLSCQLLIDPALHNANVMVLD